MNGAGAIASDARRIWREDLSRFSRLRVSGLLSMDAQMARTYGREPHCLLILSIEPAEGLPYTATVDLGTDVIDHMQAEEQLPSLRRGAAVSVGGAALQLRHIHGQPQLDVLHPTYLVIMAPAPKAGSQEDPRPGDPLCSETPES